MLFRTKVYLLKGFQVASLSQTRMMLFSTKWHSPRRTLIS